MCTLLTLNRAAYEKDQASVKAVETRIVSDAKSNPDGLCLLTVDSKGNWSRFQTKSAEMICVMLENLDWSRFWLHSRYATQGVASLSNMHGWVGRGAFVMHNGSISHPSAKKFAVDSQAIVNCIQMNGVKDTIEQFLAKEHWANVFIIRPNHGDYIVYRTSGGNLHTDGNGNYSTVSDPALGITQDVKKGYTVHKTIREVTAKYRSWENGGSSYTGYGYMSRKAGA